MKSERLKSAGVGLILLLLNLWLTRRLLAIEYLDEMGSIEGTFLAIARWVQANWHDLTWFPLWYGGIPFVNTYAPLLPRVVAAISTFTGLSIAHSYHATVAVFYSLGPVTLYWMALRLCRSRAYGFAVALFYSLVSSSTLLIPAVDYDAGGIWGLRRLQALLRYGEGPHIAALTLVPLAIVLLDIAFEKRRPYWWFLAALSSAAVILTNWLGAAALAIAALAWLLSREEGVRLRAWIAAAAVGVVACLIASPWTPPSLIFRIGQNERYVSGELSAPELRLTLFACGLLGMVVVTWGLNRLRVPAGVRFAVVFFLAASSITLGFEWLRLSLMPQPSRYHLEMEMGLALLLVFLAQLRLRQTGRWVLPALVSVVLAASVYAVIRCEKRAQRRIRPIQIDTTVEYREAKWFERTMPGRRVLAPGSVGFFLNALTDTPQFAGGFDQGVVNPLWPMVQYQVLTGDNAGEREAEIALLWLRAFGVDAVAMSGPDSREYYKPFRNPRKFEGILPELWREGDDVIYGIPRRSSSLAHIVRLSDLVSRRPESGLDVDPLRPYVAALSDSTLPVAAMRWVNRHEVEVTANLGFDQVVSLQMSHHPGWHASVGGEPRRLFGDNLGQIVVEPRCAGPCTVRLEYDGGTEMLIARIASLGCLLAGVAWTLLHLLRYRS